MPRVLVQAPEEERTANVAAITAPTPRPITLAIPYRLTPRGIDDYIARTGMEPARRFVVHLRLSDLAPGLRARAAALRSHLPVVSSDEGIASLFTSGLPALDAATEDPAALVAAWEEHLRRQAQAQAAADAAQRAREARTAEESRIFKGQMATWIADNGSEPLRTAQLRDYNVVGMYLRERVAKDFPGFEMDSKNKSKWEERANPSSQALALETEALERAARAGSGKVRIVWLIRGADGTNYKPAVRLGGGGPHPREAVVVEGYLGRYTLLREVAPEAPR